MRSPGDRLAPRGHRRQRPALHLQGQRRRHDPPARPAPGRRLAPDVPGPGQAGRGAVRVDALEPIAPDSPGDDAVGELFADVSKDRGRAAGKTVGYLARGGSPDLVFAAARRMIFHKGRDSHDYKYGAAAWEECRLAADPKWRPALAAAMMFHLPGAGTPDSPLMNRAREAVAQVMGKAAIDRPFIAASGSPAGSATDRPRPRRSGRTLALAPKEATAMKISTGSRPDRRLGRPDRRRRGRSRDSTTFAVEKSDLVSTGRNPYFVLEPGYRLEYEALRTTAEKVGLVITVLDETRTVGRGRDPDRRGAGDQGRASLRGLANYFAVCKRTNAVYYFDEDVDIYKAGKVVEPSRVLALGGSIGASIRPGDARPPDPRLPLPPEVAPGVAMDRAEVVGLAEREDPGRDIQDCVKIPRRLPWSRARRRRSTAGRSASSTTADPAGAARPGREVQTRVGLRSSPRTPAQSRS